MIPKGAAIDFAQQSAQRALRISNSLPHGLRPRQEPGRGDQLSIGLSSKFAESYLNDLSHSPASLNEELLVVHRFPAERQAMLRTHPAPLVIADTEFLSNSWDILRWAVCANSAVLVPPNISQVRD